MSVIDPTHACARVWVDELVRGGVSDACLAPGSRSAPLALALHAHPGVRLHVHYDERSAAFLALGLAKATGRPVAMLCTSGTAAANFHPAVLEASHARVPLVVLTADRPPELRDTAANQTIDQSKLYGAAVRWFAEAGVPEAREGVVAYWRALAARACAHATGSPAGPVHVNLPLREPLVPQAGAVPSRFELEGRAGGAPWTAAARRPREPDPTDVEDLARAVAAARRGLLVAGDGIVDPQTLLDLAEAAGWPVIAEPMSGCRRGRSAVSTAPLLLADPGFARAHRPDLVVRVGKIGLSRHVLRFLDADVPQVLIDPDGAWLDPTRVLAQVVAADPGILAAAVIGRLPRSLDTGWREAWSAAEQRARKAVDGILDRDDEPTEPRVARDLGALVPDAGVLTVASSMPVRDLDAHLRPRDGLRVVANRGCSGVDGFVSTAVGVALGWPGPAFALAGDLSLLHDQNGLQPAGRADLVLVVVNNDGGGIFSLLPQGIGSAFEALFGTPHGIDLARVAATAGAGHARLDGAADLPELVKAARAAGGIQMIEVRTDRGANAALHRELAAAVASVAMP